MPKSILRTFSARDGSAAGGRLSKKVSDFCLIASLLFVIILSIIPNLKVNAQLEELDKVAGLSNLKGETDVPTIVGKIINIVLGFFGLILVVMIIYGGVLWTTSGGDEEQIKKARGFISSAIIGLLIVTLSYAIAVFVIERLQNISQPTP